MKLPAPIFFFFFFFFFASSSLVALSQPASFTPLDSFLIDCGSLTNSTIDGRSWQPDSNSHYLSPSQPQILATPSSNSSTAATQNLTSQTPLSPLLLTARIFTTQSTYTFPVSPGRHWIRLYFFPFIFQSYDPSLAVFSVTAAQFTLLSHLNVVQAIQSGGGSSNTAYLFKEYSINVTADTLSITFVPDSATAGSYAFVNALEVVSMPPDLILDQTTYLGNSTPVPIGIPYMAMETMYRINVGGPLVTPANDTVGLYRTWLANESYLYSASGVENVSTTKAAIGYSPSVSQFIAPPIVYSTALQMSPSQTAQSRSFNISWLFPVAANFRYVVRLHFCEIVESAPAKRIFDVYLQNQTAYANVDLALKYAQDQAHYRDFSLDAPEGVTSLWIRVGPAPNTPDNNAILNGIEIWKLSNLEGSLDGQGSVDVSLPASKRNVGPIAGAVVGGVVAMGLLLVVFCLFCRRRSKIIKHPPPAWVPLQMHEMNSVSLASKMSTGSHRSGTGSYVSSAPSSLGRFFTFAEIREATNNFDEALVIGVGGFGKVYLGELEVGTKVAVKRGNPRSGQGITEFQTEIEMLSKLRHRHLVSLIGYCEEHREMILVYEYMANGPLRSHLYGSDLPPLSWRQRLEICIGAARGLHYLHTGAAQGIIHRDVKTTNILLDENLVAKVSDFGLSKTGPTLDRTHVSTAVKGSFGYLDPEYFRRQQLTEKSDVYSFGVVLMEVLCARPAINPALPRDQVNIAEWAMHWQNMGLLDQIIDPHLAGTINMESLRKFGETAEKCLAEQGIDRPAMGAVLWNLEYALQLQETAMANDMDGDSTNQISELPILLPAPEQWEASAVVENLSTGSEEGSEDATTSAIFSQLVNPQGR